MRDKIDLKECHKFSYEGHTVLYFPHYHKAVLSDGNICSDIDLGICVEIKGIEPSDWLRCARLMVIPTNRCNFNCSYCFSAKGRKNGSYGDLSFESFRRTVDNLVFHLEKNGRTQPLFIRFLGGGEPLMATDLIIKGTEYVYQEYSRLTPEIRIVSNGYFLNEDLARWAKKWNVLFELSFDILEDVHNIQRNCYAQILNKIKLVDQLGCRYRLRCVVTDLNVDRMTEMVKQAKQDLPNLNFIQMELVSSDDVSIETFEKFAKGFFRARLVADNLGVSLGCSKIDSFKYPRLFHCVPEFCLNQDGEVTFCHRLSSHDEPYFSDFYIGKELETIDISKVANILSTAGYKDECNKCIAKYHCAGGCYHNNLYMSAHKKSLCKYRILSVCIQALHLASEELFLHYISSSNSTFEFEIDKSQE